MTIINERLKELRINERYMQAQIAEMCGVTQVTIGRYETGMCEPPIDKLLWYAEKFDVSLDYIFGRTNNPKGMLYQTMPSADANSLEIRNFVDMCFDPESPMSEKLKIFLVNMLEEKMSNKLTPKTNEFSEIVSIIDNARTRALKAVNTELIEMYWQIGKYISEKNESDGWGKGVVQEFSNFLKQTYPGTSRFSAQNIWRMKQFYETYRNNEKLSPLVREIT